MFNGSCSPYSTASTVPFMIALASSLVNNLSPSSVKYVPSSVRFTAEVDYYTEKTVEVPIIGLNFPADKQLRTFPSKAKITFRIGAASFKRITQDSFVLAITYEELLDGLEKYRLHLKSIPEGVSNIRIIPAEVDYLIEQVEGVDE